MRSPWPEPPPGVLESRFRSMKLSRLRNYVEAMQFELQYAERILGERKDVEARIQTLTVNQLEHFVLAKKPSWQFAKQLLDRKRASGADLGHKPESPPAVPNMVPHSPDGTDGDYWRIKGG